MDKTYRAFISYSHRDEGFARWLHRQLESWRVPRDLVGRETPHGPVPASLRPIFRDRDDFSGGSSLRDATLDALKASDALIVICSPDAARSTYVDEEIRLFKAMGRAGRVVAIIASGTPGGRDDECFPAWLRHDPDETGAGKGAKVEPIAADARDEGDGPRRAVAKLVAGLLAVPFDEIIRRAETQRRARNALYAGAIVGAVAFAAMFSAYALYQSYAANVAIEKSVFAIGGLLKSTDRLPRDDDVGDLRRSMLREQCDLMDALAGSRVVPGVRERGICFYERSVSAGDSRTPAQVAGSLCRWRDELLAAIGPREEPVADEAEALTHALDRTYAWIASDPSAAGECEPKGAPSLDRHLRFLIGALTDLGRKRPDITDIRIAHENAVWPLVQLLEEEKDWAGSQGVMVAAAELRLLQMGEPAADAIHPAAIDRALYLRRLSWLASVHLTDFTAAASFGRDAVDLWTTLETAGPANVDIAFQSMLARQVLGEALVGLGKSEEGIVELRAALGKARALADRFGADEPEMREKAEQSITYLEERLAALGAG